MKYIAIALIFWAFIVAYMLAVILWGVTGRPKQTNNKTTKS